MENISLVLSITASVGTLISIIMNVSSKKEISKLNRIINHGNSIQSKGNNNTNVSGNSNKIN